MEEYMDGYCGRRIVYTKRQSTPNRAQNSAHNR
jgi:hypothetical protein